MDGCLELSDIQSWEYTQADSVYDLTVEDDHCYYLDCGKEILVHNSSKTWDTYHFIYAFCDHNRGKGNDIYVLRDTLTNCRDLTFKDFKNCMKVIGADLNYVSEGQKPYVNIFGNHVYFRGLDTEENAEGYPSDIIFVNEALETDKTQVDGLKMRCRKLMIMDWNPKFTEHWCFDLEHQPDVFFTRSNYKNNKHLNKSVVKEIEGYEPWLPGSYEIKNHKLWYKGQLVDEKNQPPPHPKNIENRTVDSFRWKVYGLGLRGAMEGVIFDNVSYIDEFPNLAHTYGLDFGFTVDPLTLVKHAESTTDIYLELFSYDPIETPEDVDLFLKGIGISKREIITADSSDKYTSESKGAVQMVSSLRNFGWNISKVRKTKNVMFWIQSMKKKKINIVLNKRLDKSHMPLNRHVVKEQENYRFKEVNGIKINQPEDKYNHFWDAGRYSHMAHNSPRFEPSFG